MPYKGWAQNGVALLGWHVDAIVINAGEGRALVDEGRLRILGVFQAQRVPYHPTCPPSRRSATTWAWA